VLLPLAKKLFEDAKKRDLSQFKERPHAKYRDTTRFNMEKMVVVKAENMQNRKNVSYYWHYFHSSPCIGVAYELGQVCLIISLMRKGTGSSVPAIYVE